MASSTLPPPLALFHLFPKLIPELRIYIWHIALEIPRLVVIWKHENRGSDYIRRSVGCPLLSVNMEARREALRIYSSPQTGPCLLSAPSPYSLQTTEQRQAPVKQSIENPYFIGPGTDIVYISGTDPPLRRYKTVSWTTIFLSQDLDSAAPTFAPIRRLAVNEEFLRMTPYFQFTKMPYSIWKLILSDLRPVLEELIVVRGGGSRWGKREVEGRLREAMEGFRRIGVDGCEDEEETQEIRKWKCPTVRMMTFVELVGECWTSEWL